MKSSLIFVLILASCLMLPAQDESFIRLQEIDARHCLIGPDGKPFFAHGITHVSTKRAKLDYDKLSAACKELVFNAYGYGCSRPKVIGAPSLANSWPFYSRSVWYNGSTCRTVNFSGSNTKILSRFLRRR